MLEKCMDCKKVITHGIRKIFCADCAKERRNNMYRNNRAKVKQVKKKVYITDREPLNGLIKF